MTMKKTDKMEDKLRIEISARFAPEKSNPEENRYAFIYAIEITNLGNKSVQILNRKWTITNSDYQEHRAGGDGVIGKQPIIAPHKSFKYTSGVMLDTEMGTMEGEYTLRHEDGFEFHVPIEKFVLSVPRTLN